MTCQRVLSQVENLIDGELSPAEAEQVQKHLEGCLSCREEFLTVQRLKQLLGQMPACDPGRDYWDQTERLILERTINVQQSHWQTPRGTTDKVRLQHNALMRALASLAASLFVLVSAILIGTNSDGKVSRMSAADVPILATAPGSELLGTDNKPLVTQAEQVRLAKGMLLMGSPGFLGRFTGLPDLMVMPE